MQYTIVLRLQKKVDTLHTVWNFRQREVKGILKEEALENIKEAVELVLEVAEEQARILGEIAKVDVASA